MSNCCRFAIVLCFFATHGLIAEESPPAGKLETLPAILSRIHEHVATKAWREEGWKDEQIEIWLEQVVGKIAVAAKLPELKLPVRFADVKPSEGTTPPSRKNTLLVGKNFNLRPITVSRCIVLADGNVMADRLENCIVIARGVISAGSTESSILIGGAYVRSTTDGQVSALGKGSLFATPGWAHVDTINGSVVYAGEGITTGSRVEGGVFINTTLVGNELTTSSILRRPRSVKVRDLPFGELVNHALHDQLTILGVIYPEAIDPPDRLSVAGILNGSKTPKPRPTGVVLRFEGRRYVVNIGTTIVDQAKKPVPSLAGWKLSYVNDKTVIFSKGDADAILRVEES